MAKKSNAEIAGEFRDHMAEKGYAFWMDGGTMRVQKVGSEPGEANVPQVIKQFVAWLTGKKIDKSAKQKEHIFGAFKDVLPKEPPQQQAAKPKAE